MTQITIRAKVIEKIEDGLGFPEKVRVTGAEALTAAAVWEIAQEAVNSHFGSYSHGYHCVRSFEVTDDVTVPVRKP